MDRTIANVLSIGVILSAVLMAAGLGTGTDAWIRYGIWVLVLLPAIRVAVAGVLFYRREEFNFTVIALLILTILSLSLYLGTQAS